MTDKKKSSRPERPPGYYSLRRIVAANIRDQRQRRGWSLSGLAGRLAPYLGEMGAPAISAWEASRTDGSKAFTVEEIHALAVVFEIKVFNLLEPPRLLDMDPIESGPGEESPRRIADVWGMDEEATNTWRRWLALKEQM